MRHLGQTRAYYDTTCEPFEPARASSFILRSRRRLAGAVVAVPECLRLTLVLSVGASMLEVCIQV
jgi:hypothetical protein